MNEPSPAKFNRRVLFWLSVIIILEFGLFFVVKLAGIQTQVFVYQLF